MREEIYNYYLSIGYTPAQAEYYTNIELQRLNTAVL